jgi:hypothetical protein
VFYGIRNEIPEKSWNSISIFYSGQIVENKAGLTEWINWPRKYGEDRDTGIERVGEQVQNLLNGRKARLQGITEVNRTRQLAKDKRELTESKDLTNG